MDMIFIITIAVSGLLGLLLCFKGYNILRISLSVVGAVVGYVLAREILSHITADISEQVRWGVLAVFAIGLGAASFALYEKAVFIIGAAGGGFFAWSLYPQDSTGIEKWVVVALAALVSGLAVKFINEWALKLFTAIFGARLLAYSLALMVSRIDLLSTGVSTLMLMLFKTAEISPFTSVSGLILVTFGVWGFAHQLKK